MWDARTCTLLQSFNSHDNDVLSIAANHDGSIMYAAGMDGKIVMFNHVRAVTDEFTMDNGAQDNSSSLKQWAMTHNRRFHTHDVRSLVLLEWLDIAPPMQQSSKSLKRGRNGVASASAQQASGFSGRVIMDHLISGGVDTQLSVLAHPSDRFPRAIMQPVRLSPFPKQPMTHICAEKRLLLTHDNDRLALWRLGNALEVTTGTATEAILTQEQTAAAPKVPTAELLPLQTGPEFLLELRVRDGMHVLCSDISSDGQWIAACDATRVHLFQIKVGQ